MTLAHPAGTANPFAGEPSVGITAAPAVPVPTILKNTAFALGFWMYRFCAPPLEQVIVTAACDVFPTDRATVLPSGVKLRPFATHRLRLR
jgi:hypothetical protein